MIRKCRLSQTLHSKQTDLLCLHKCCPKKWLYKRTPGALQHHLCRFFHMKMWNVRTRCLCACEQKERKRKKPGAVSGSASSSHSRRDNQETDPSSRFSLNSGKLMTNLKHSNTTTSHRLSSENSVGTWIKNPTLFTAVLGLEWSDGGKTAKM